MLDNERVRELAGRRGDPAVTSLYLDVDGRRYPRASDFEPHLTTLCHTARQKAALLGPAAESAVDADVDRIRRWLAESLHRSTTRGVAVFSCARQGWLDALTLPVSVRDQVSVLPEPDVGPLLTVLEHRRRTLVVLADRQQARLLRVELGVVEERPGVRDEPERQADTDVELGGWDRRREEAARRHFRRVASVVEKDVRTWDPHGVILAGSSNDLARLRASLGTATAARVVATMPLPISASAREVELATLEVTRDAEHRHELDLVERLHERAPQDRKAAMGLPAVLAALRAKRVATLVVARGFQAAGARCAACGHVGLAACHCPECGTPSTTADDIVDVAIAEALAQNATVELCDGTDLDFFGGIGALERF
jgi:hypothetical protein